MSLSGTKLRALTLKTVSWMIQCIGNYRKKTYSDKKQISGCQELEIRAGDGLQMVTEQLSG